MKDIVRVAAAQMDAQWLDPEANLAKVESFLDKIQAEDRVELVVFPELASSGYIPQVGLPQGGRDEEFMRNCLRAAQKIPGPFTEGLSKLARKHNIYIVAGILEEHPLVTATLYNSAVLVGPSGEIVGVYRKVHIPGEEKHYFYPGSSLEVFATDLGKVGMLICADTAFPETARILSLKGAEIICASQSRWSFPRTAINREISHRTVSCRASENQNFVVACNRAGRQGDVAFDGGSCIAGPKGEYIALSEVDTEDIVRATLPAKAMYEIRILKARFRDRRPELYSPLCQPF